MTALQRPPHCPYCDGVADDKMKCIGVKFDVYQWWFCCKIGRQAWDAGHAAGVAQEREAQAVDAQAKLGKVWI